MTPLSFFRAENDAELRKYRFEGTYGLNQQNFDLRRGTVLNATAALEMTDREFQLVLIFEHFEESLVLLANLLCIPLSMVTSLNINSQGFDKVVFKKQC